MEVVLRNADEAGVQWIITSGMDLQSSERAVELTFDHEYLLASVGIHPWFTAEIFPPDFYEKIRDRARNAVTVTVGEVGLDFIDNVFSGVSYYDNPGLRRAQEEAFKKQIELACSLNLSLIMHARGAYRSIIRILREEKAFRVGGVIHNFDGTEKDVSQLMDMGFYLSFGGAVTYLNKAITLKETVRTIPLDYILTETDSPYMPPDGGIRQEK